MLNTLTPPTQLEIDWDAILEEAGHGLIEDEGTVSLDALADAEYDAGEVDETASRTLHGYDEGCLYERHNDRVRYSVRRHNEEIGKEPGERPTEADAILSLIVGYLKLWHSYPMPYYYSGTSRHGYEKRRKTPGWKTCTRCGVYKPVDKFHTDRSRSDNKHPHCKTCRREQRRSKR